VDADTLAHVEKAWLAMNTTDPEARWLYQGWIWNNAVELGQSGASLRPAMRAFAAGTPPGRFLASDMWAEWRPIGQDLSAAGLPFLFGTLQNFGGEQASGGGSLSQPHEFGRTLRLIERFET
jgi:hypothetical protein